MTENLTLAILILTPLLYSLGGMFWKPLRRYGIPLFFLLCSIVTGSFSWQIILACFALGVALTLPYGEKYPWFIKVIYAICISLPALIIKFNFWMLILPIVFITTFYLSNKPKWQYIFNWRICEFLTGSFLGILWSQIL